jgi:hypothetical protein
MTAKTPWAVVKASLIARGLWDADGITRKARGRLCSQCGAPVIVGLDHDRCAMAVFLDPSPVNVLGEAMALLAGRQSYSLRWVGGHYEIDVRYPEHITGSPAGTNSRLEVLATHVCHSAPLPNSLRGQAVAAPTPIKGADRDLDDQPPF